MKSDLYSRITDQIARELEQGVQPWHKPWSVGHAAGPVSRGTTVCAAFEDDADAERFAKVFRPEQTTRELDGPQGPWRGWMSPLVEESRASPKECA